MTRTAPAIVTLMPAPFPRKPFINLQCRVCLCIGAIHKHILRMARQSVHIALQMSTVRLIQFFMLLESCIYFDHNHHGSSDYPHFTNIAKNFPESMFSCPLYSSSTLFLTAFTDALYPRPNFHNSTTHFPWLPLRQTFNVPSYLASVE